jgi:hypothetical protein
MKWALTEPELIKSLMKLALSFIIFGCDGLIAFELAR